MSSPGSLTKLDIELDRLRTLGYNGAGPGPIKWAPAQSYVDTEKAKYRPFAAAAVAPAPAAAPARPRATKRKARAQTYHTRRKKARTEVETKVEEEEEVEVDNNVAIAGLEAAELEAAEGLLLLSRGEVIHSDFPSHIFAGLPQQQQRTQQPVVASPPAPGCVFGPCCRRRRREAALVG
jgi:hypothetical protein